MINATQGNSCNALKLIKLAQHREKHNDEPNNAVVEVARNCDNMSWQKSPLKMYKGFHVPTQLFVQFKNSVP